MRIATQFTAGDDLAWTDTPFVLADGTQATALTHALTYSFRGPVKTAGVDVVCAASAIGWQANLTSAATRVMNQGPVRLIWYWQAIAVAVNGGARTTVAKGQIAVQPNLSALQAGASSYDGRSQAEQNLAAVRAEIQGRINGGLTTDYTIGNRSLRKEPVAALLSLETKLKMDVQREKSATSIANGLGNPGRTFVRWGRR